MSGCRCEESRNFRVSGEPFHHPAEIDVGDAPGFRIRCAECGGKVSTVGNDLLRALGLDESEIKVGGLLRDGEQEDVTLTVDLL